MSVMPLNWLGGSFLNSDSCVIAVWIPSSLRDELGFQASLAVNAVKEFHLSTESSSVNVVCTPLGIKLDCLL